ncbi:MAG: serine hydrolase domain-containing protein [Bacteroidota bacterium]|nr:serine hydrolase domain-containing protein [Bacteroidota bacterium]
MKKKHILILLLLLSSGFIYSQSDVVMNNLTTNNLITETQKEGIYNKLNVFPNKTQVSIALIENGNVKIYGIEIKNDTISYLENYNSVFEIGSITKLFTSTLLANFVINKKINLDDNINQFLTIPFNDSICLTFKQLATHTSGLPRMANNFTITALLHMKNPFKYYTEEKLEKYIRKKMKLVYDQNERPHYSNVGVGILAYTLCNIANNDFETLLDSLIFSRYEMNNSSSHKNEVLNKLVIGLNKKGKETPNWDMGSIYGAGSILSTVEDLSKFALAQFDNSNKELVLTRQVCVTDTLSFNMGLGWHIFKPYDDTWYFHNGRTGGYSSGIMIDVVNKNGIIILSNVSAYNKQADNIDDLCVKLMKTLNKQ